MLRLERLLFYPAVLAATVFAVRQVLIAPSPAAFAALVALGLLWVVTVFRAMFWLARMAFWAAVLIGAGTWAWFRFGGGV